MENTWKAIITAAMAALTIYLQQMIIPVLILIAVMVLDYVSGTVSAAMKGEISSATGLLGIAKKCGYLVLVMVGMVMDYLIQTGLGKLGVDMTGTFAVAMLVTIWLIINELISIVENCGEMGLPVPAFMRKMLEKLKSETEKTTDIDIEKQEENPE